MTISSSDRLLARQQAFETSRIEQLGSRAIARAINRVKGQYKRAMRSKLLMPGYITKLLMAELPTLLDAVTVSYLLGRKRAATAVSVPAALSFSAGTSKQVEFLRRLFNLTSEELNFHRQKFDSQLREILNATGTNADKKIQEAMIESLVHNEHVGPATRRLDAAFDAAGLTPKNSYKVESIFRTQCQMAYSGAKWEAGQTGLMGSMLWGYLYVTAGDDRVRDNHEALDGVTLPKGDPWWQTIFPPNGYNCRCQCIELFEPRPIVLPPDDTVPDKGFEFNPGQILGTKLSLTVSDETEGRWITVRGNKIFIKEGQDIGEVLKERFGKKEKVGEKEKDLTQSTMDRQFIHIKSSDQVQGPKELSRIRAISEKLGESYKVKRQQAEKLHDEKLVKQFDLARMYSGETSMGYESMNAVLREEKTPSLSVEERNRVFKNNNLLKEFISKQSPTSEDFIVFRGSSGRTLREKYSGAKVGDKLSLPGFLSTSLQHNIAKSFDSRTQMQIKIPKGSTGVLCGFNTPEREILLNHNSNFKLLKIEKFKNKGSDYATTILQLEYLGTDPK